MAIKNVRFQFRGADTDKKINDTDILLAGEPGYQDGILKVGDGKTKWSELPKIGAVDTTLTMAGMAADAKTVGDKIAEILYKAIDITSFTASPSSAEKGATVSVTLNWNINKTPNMQVLQNLVISNSMRSKTYTGVTEDKTYTLQVRDEKDATDTRSASVKFYNGVYYGAATKPASYNSTFIKSLANKSLQGSKAKTFSVTAGTGQYIYFCLPTSYGTPTFNVGGFDGGFIREGEISFTNASGYTENYNIYRSENANLGYTTVKVS